MRDSDTRVILNICAIAQRALSAAVSVHVAGAVNGIQRIHVLFGGVILTISSCRADARSYLIHEQIEAANGMNLVRQEQTCGTVTFGRTLLIQRVGPHASYDHVNPEWICMLRGA